MKRTSAALALFALALSSQQYSAGEMKHLQVPTGTSVRPVSVAALEIEREPHYPGVIHLKGRVEIKTPLCVVTGAETTHTCDGYIVLRADEVDFHEDSGQADARGHVTMTREK